MVEPTETDEGRRTEPQREHMPRVLVVDDDDQFRRALVNSLRELTHSNVVTRDTPTGESAIAILRNEPNSFDLVLLDLTLPGINGVVTYYKIREFNQSIGIVLMTSAVNGPTARSAIQDGLKVFDKYQLPQQLDTLLVKYPSAS